MFKSYYVAKTKFTDQLVVLKLENGFFELSAGTLNFFLKIKTFEIGQAAELGNIRLWKVGNRRNNGLESPKF